MANKKPQTVEYLACHKSGRKYALAFHTKAGVSDVPGEFSGEQVDRVRAYQRKIKLKKLTDAKWNEFLATL